MILTDRCNLTCTYCFVRNNRSASHIDTDMSPTIASQAISLYSRLVCRDEGFERTIVFYGGEPLLNRSTLIHTLSEIHEAKSADVIPSDTKLSMVTNGTNVDQSLADILAEHDVAVGVSIDGSAEHTDGERGGGVARSARHAIDLLRNRGVRVGASVTISHANCRNADSLVDSLAAAGIRSLGFNILMGGEDQGVTQDYIHDATILLIRAYELFRDKGIYEDRVFRKAKSFAESRPLLFDCGAAGANQIVVAPDGEVGICHAMLGSRKYFCFRVTDEHFDPRQSPEFSEWARRTPINMPDCQDCRSLGICGGGCPFSASLISGSIWGIDNRYCEFAAGIFDWLVWDTFKSTSRGIGDNGDSSSWADG